MIAHMIAHILAHMIAHILAQFKQRKGLSTKPLGDVVSRIKPKGYCTKSKKVPCMLTVHDCGLMVMGSIGVH